MPVNYDRKKFVEEAAYDVTSEIDGMTIAQVLEKYGPDSYFHVSEWYSDTTISIYRNRLESDEEYNKRIAKEESAELKKQLKAEARAKKKAELVDKKRQEELEMYAYLKKKYGEVLDE